LGLHAVKRMNKNRQILTNSLRKNSEKAIKKAQKALSKSPDLLRTDTLLPDEALSQYPAKRRKVEKPLMEATVKKMALEKKKKTTAHSKRTAPGEVSHRESSPKSVHPESTRWEKTVKLQNKVHNKALTRKLQKRK